MECQQPAQLVALVKALNCHGRVNAHLFHRVGMQDVRRRGYSKETHPFLMRSNQFVMLMLCAALPADDTSALRRVYVMGPGRVRPGVFAAGAVDIFCRSRSQHTEVPPQRKLGGKLSI